MKKKPEYYGEFRQKLISVVREKGQIWLNGKRLRIKDLKVMPDRELVGFGELRGVIISKRELDECLTARGALLDRVNSRLHLARGVGLDPRPVYNYAVSLGGKRDYSRFMDSCVVIGLISRGWREQLLGPLAGR